MPNNYMRYQARHLLEPPSWFVYYSSTMFRPLPKRSPVAPPIDSRHWIDTTVGVATDFPNFDSVTALERDSTMGGVGDTTSNSTQLDTAAFPPTPSPSHPSYPDIYIVA